MKNIIFSIIFTIVFSSSSIFGQNKNDVVFSFCKLTGPSIAFSDFEKCLILTSNHKNLEIKSFRISILVNSKEHPDGLYMDVPVTGNSITKATLSLFNKLHLDDPFVKVMIEDIVTIDSGKTKKYNGFTFWLK